MKKKKFPQDVARFFSPQKSGTNGSAPLYLGTHQLEKNRKRSNIPVYDKGGTARKAVDGLGRVTYK